MDPPFQEEFAELLEGLSREGVTILMVTHDVEFCARHATRCALLFDGQVQAEGTPRAFFTQNGFYTTAASRMARQLLPEAMTAEEVIKACGGREPEVKPASQAVAERHVSPAGQKKRRSPGFVRVLGGVLLAGCALCGTLAWQGVAWLAPLAAGKWLPSLAWLAALMVSLAMLGVGRKPSGARAEIRPRPGKTQEEGSGADIGPLCGSHSPDSGDGCLAAGGSKVLFHLASGTVRGVDPGAPDSGAA